MQQKADRSAILGTMDMRRLVPKVSVPIMISMIVQALYNIVDSIFVSRFDPNGLTAVSLAFPFQMLMIALSTGMGTGLQHPVYDHRALPGRSADEARGFGQPGQQGKHPADGHQLPVHRHPVEHRPVHRHLL